MMSLIGCTTKPIKNNLPPQIYLIPCNQSDFTGTTYGEAIIYLRQVMNERDVCASRLNGVIEWSKQYGVMVD